MSNCLRYMLSVIVFVLPWRFRRVLLNKILGYRIHPNAKIGFAFVCPKNLEMDEGSYIGHLSVCKDIDLIKLGKYARIGTLNWISGAPSGHSVHFIKQEGRRPELTLEDHAHITSRHLIDCTNSVHIGHHSTIAGFRSLVMTHSVDMRHSRQWSAPITIGCYCLVGTNCLILGGAGLPDYSVLRPFSLLNKTYKEPWTVYSGNPATPERIVPKRMKYFSRPTGFIK